MKNEKVKQFVEKAKIALTHAGKIVVILAAMIFGFVVGDVYHRFQKQENESTKQVINLKNVHKLDKTSVAINERNELMIIDRESGNFELYQDSIGNVIFSLYAGRIYSNTAETK